MIGKLKNIVTEKYFHIVIIIIIIFIFLFALGMMILRYNVEGETNMPFELTKITLISSCEGMDVESTDTRWAFDVYQSNDIFLYLNKNENYEKTEAIQSIIIDNIEIESNQKDNIKLYKPDKTDENQIFKNIDENIVETITYEGAMKSNLKELAISNQGGLIAFRLSNNGIARYTSNDEVINHLELLKKAGIKQEDLKTKITFDLTIQIVEGKKYKTTISLDLPVENVVEQGTTSKEITDLSEVIFKRINN